MKKSRLIIGLGIGAAVAGALAAGNRYLDGWENLEPEDAAEGEFCTLSNDWRIHFISKGEGSPVVLLHGFMDTLQSWRGNVEELAKRHRVIALDAPGFGSSERVRGQVYSIKAQARVLAEFLDRQGVEKTALVGHSLGGALAAQFAYNFPWRVTRLVLVDAAVYLRVPRTTRLVGRIPRFLTRGAIGIYSMNGAGIRASLKNAYGDARRVQEESVHVRTRASRVQGTAEALVSMIGSLHDSDLPEAAAGLTMPTLIVWGEKDPVLPLSHARRLQHELPDARLAIVAGAGHLPHEEMPEKMNQLLTGFLD